MNPKIKELLAQITALEDDLRIALRQQEATLQYHIKGKKVEFEKSIRQTHRKLKRNILHWIVTDRPQNILTGPFIYGLIIPLLILDLFVSVYQAVCFPVYKIAKVKREDFIVLDRNRLDYLNWFEKFHCDFCAYANGLLAYTSEISARTEQYFCPIKHARRIVNTHARYERFLDFGDAEDYHAKLEAFRQALVKDAGNKDTVKK